MKSGRVFVSLVMLLGGMLAGVIWSHQRDIATVTAQKAGPVSGSIRAEGPLQHPEKIEAIACDTPAGVARTVNDTGTGGSPYGPLSPRSVWIGPQIQQRAGVRVELVEAAAQRHVLRTLGRVAPDEARVYPLLAATSGWVWEVRDITTGAMVQKDQLLALYYSREFFSAQQSYFSALDYVHRLKQQAQPQLIATDDSGEAEPGNVRAPLRTSPMTSYRYTEDQVLAAQQQLFELGMGETQIQEIARSRDFAVDIELRAPAAGVVLARNIFPGQRFDRGTEFFRIADLRRIWILTEVFERDARFIRPGLAAKVRLPHQGESFAAVVSDVLHPFDETTRTFKVRLEVDNPDHRLLPNMLVDVELAAELPPIITVPADAVIDSGLSKTVFISLGEGYFEPRRIEIGRRIGDRVEIIEGVRVRESIVVGGTFLVDSESRMKPADTGRGGPPGASLQCRVEPGTAHAGDSQSKSHSHSGVGHHH